MASPDNIATFGVAWFYGPFRLRWVASRIPFTYVLRTGRFWKAHIGKACITVHARGIPFTAIQEVTPPGFVIDEQQNTLSWTFENLYPEDDIGVLLSPSIIQGDAIGMVIDDVLRINESRPPTNTAVVVGGRICGGDGFDCNVYELREGFFGNIRL